jgi:hypothetical protein
VVGEYKRSGQVPSSYCVWGLSRYDNPTHNMVRFVHEIAKYITIHTMQGKQIFKKI